MGKVIDNRKLSKAFKEWEALQPLDEADLHRLNRRFVVDFNYNSNHIEGNTLTYGQTELLLIFGKVIGEADLKDCNEMKASDLGLKMTEIESLSRDMPLTQNFIRELHKVILREDYKVFHRLPNGEYSSYVVHAGQYKTRPNSVITRSGERFEYASPEETPALMGDLVEWYNTQEKERSLNPVELAALFHYRYIRIHPFEDGNGRIARLLSNYILSRHGWPMVVVRSRKKQEYLDSLSASDRVVGSAPSLGAKATLLQIRHFLGFFSLLVAEEVSNDVKFVREKNPELWWYDGEMIRFRSHKVSEILYSLIIDPAITIDALSNKVGLAPRVVSRHIKNLIDRHFIARRENGAFYVFITPSIL